MKRWGLAPALALLLAGCDAKSTASVTFTKDVAPILFEHCAACHRPGESAPFSLLTYDDARAKRRQMARVTRRRVMPPWLPAPGHPEFVGARRLTDAEIEKLQRWCDDDAPEGDSAELPVTPTWADGWQLRQPDLVVTLAEPFDMPADGPDVFRNFVLPIPVDQLRFVQAVEVRPESPAAHHAILQVDATRGSRRLAAEDELPGFGGMYMGFSRPPDGHFLGWTPGKSPSVAPAGMAWRLLPGSDFVLQLHMTPTGKPERVQPRIGLVFTDQEPDRFPFSMVLFSETIDIPAGDANYTVRDSLVLPVDVEVLGVYPHAHYLCRRMHGFARSPDGEVRTLIQIDAWDFDWQDEYRFVEPISLAAGTEIGFEYVYDNSIDNTANPNTPPRRVVFGQEAANEMGTLSFTLLPKDHDGLLALRAARWRHTIDKKSWDWGAHLQLAKVLRDQGDPEGAVAQLQEALRLRPQYPDAWCELGMVWESVGQLGRADGAYQRALQADTKHAEANLQLGTLAARRGDLGQALAHFEVAVEASPEMPEAHNNLATALFQSHRLAEAAEEYRATLKLRSDHFFARFNLGRVLIELGDRNAGLVELRRAAALRPEHPELRAELEKHGE